MKTRSRKKHQVTRPSAHQLPAPPPTASARGFRQFDISIAADPPPKWPKVSVCLIAKNEASNLRSCLESLGDLPSEIIVVDTGSTDDTVAIAESLGARAYRFPWIADFAAARNESLRHATKQWVFWLDADDRLTPKTVAQLKVAAGLGTADAYTCLVSSTEADGRRTTTDHMRLFRNGMGIAFSGAIHETVLPSLVRLGLRLAHTDMLVEHTGYISQDTVREKAARNLAIIDHQLALQPGQTGLIFYRGHARSTLEMLDEAASDMREYLARTKPSALFDHMRFWAHAVLARILVQKQELEATEALLLSALAEFPGHPFFLHMQGCLYLVRGRPEEALSPLRLALQSLEGAVRGLKPHPTWMELKLAETCRALGQKEEAIRWAEQAIAHSSDPAEAQTLLARLYMESGRIPEAERLAAELLTSAGIPDPWLFLAEVRHRQGRWEEATSAIQEAQARGLPETRAEQLLASMKAATVLAKTRSETRTKLGSPQQTQMQIRGLSLLAQGERLKAAECFAEAIQAAPTDSNNYRYLAVALRELGREAEAVEAWRLAEHWQKQV